MKREPTLRELLERAIRKFKAANPRARFWSDEQCLESLFLLAARQKGSRFSVVGRGSDGKLEFCIKLRRTGRTG